EYALILETLINQGICQICGASGNNLKEFGQRYKEEGKCIVCGSPVQYPRDFSIAEVEVENDLSETINVLRESLDKLESEQRACIRAQDAANAEVRRVQDAIAQEARTRRHLESSMAELRSKFMAKTGDEPPSDQEEDPWLTEQRHKVDRLTAQIDALY